MGSRSVILFGVVGTFLVILVCALAVGYGTNNYLFQDGSIPLTGNWNAGAFSITSTRLYINDANSYIDEDIAHNMIFVDAITGSKTLAQLAIVGEGNGDCNYTGLLFQNGTRPLTANWNVGGFDITNIGSLVATDLDTGHGAYELYAMDQDVDTTASPFFSSITTSNAGGLHILDTDASHDLILKTNENLASDTSLFFRVAGSDRTLTFSGNPTLADWFDQSVKTGSGVTFLTVNTGQGAYELFAMNQDVESTDAVTFATVDTGEGANELFDMDQNVLVASAVAFATLDTGQGAYELFAMNQDVESTDSPSFSALDLTSGSLTMSTGTGSVFLGTGGKIDFADEVGDKIYLYETLHGIGTSAGEMAFWVYQASDHFSFRLASRTGTEVLRITGAGGLIPAGTGTADLGTDTAYFGDINYKTLDDRGCPAYIQGVDTIAMVMNIKPHETEKSIHELNGELLPRFDVTSLPDYLRNIPTAEDYVIAQENFEKAHSDWEKRRLEPDFDEKLDPKPQYLEVGEGLKFDLLVYNMLTAMQYQQLQIEMLEARILALEEGK